MQSISDQAIKLLLEQDLLQTELNYEMGFTALGLAYLDWERGVSVFERILAKIGSDEYLTAEGVLLQPPLFGFLLAGFYETAPDEASAISFLHSVYEKVLDYHRFLYQERDPEEDGLLVITHPTENLLFFLTDKVSDFNPIASSDGGQWQDPLFNALLIWSNECLMEIGAMLEADVTEILLWNELTTYTLNEKLWQEEAAIYQPFDIEHQEQMDFVGIGSFLPLIGEIPDQDMAEMMLERLENEDLQYLLKPLPASGEERLPPNCKISITANWLLYHGLWRFGMTSAAHKVRQFSMDLMERYGFRKVYDFSNGFPDLDGDVPAYLPAAALCLAWQE